jgi:hypothetical protein
MLRTLDLPADASITDREPLAAMSSEVWELLSPPRSSSEEFAFVVEDLRIIHATKKIRKYFLEFRLQVRDPDTDQRRTIDAIAKVYPSDRGAYHYQVLTHLWKRGFRDDTPYAVPQPLGYLPERCLLLQGKASGAPLGNQLHHPQAGPLGARAAARWLVHLHGLPAETELFHRIDPTAKLDRYHGELRATLPTQAARLDKLYNRLLDLLEGDAEKRPVSFIHGDYHAKNVFLSDGQVTVIDFDTFGVGEPAHDLGYFLAQNAIMAWLRHSSLQLAEAPGQAFLEEYAKHRGTILWPRITAYIARTFLQSLHYELCVLHTGDLGLVNLWLDFMEDALDRATRGAPWSPLVMGAGG